MNCQGQILSHGLKAMSRKQRQVMFGNNDSTTWLEVFYGKQMTKLEQQKS